MPFSRKSRLEISSWSSLKFLEIPWNSAPRACLERASSVQISTDFVWNSLFWEPLEPLFWESLPLFWEPGSLYSGSLCFYSRSWEPLFWDPWEHYVHPTSNVYVSFLFVSLSFFSGSLCHATRDPYNRGYLHDRGWFFHGHPPWGKEPRVQPHTYFLTVFKHVCWFSVAVLICWENRSKCTKLPKSFSIYGVIHVSSHICHFSKIFTNLQTYHEMFVKLLALCSRICLHILLIVRSCTLGLGGHHIRGRIVETWCPCQYP